MGLIESMGSTESPDFNRLGNLARQAQEGDRDAYETLLEELYAYVRRVLIARLGVTPDLDDLTQTCLLAMHRALPSYHPSRSIRPWVQAIIRYKIADHFRALARCREFAQSEELLEVQHQANTDRAGVDSTLDQVNITVLMEKLPAELEKAVRLTKLDGLSCTEAAKNEGISAGALRKRVSRAYRKLADLVEKELES